MPCKVIRWSALQINLHTFLQVILKMQSGTRSYMCCTHSPHKPHDHIVLQVTIRAERRLRRSCEMRYGRSIYLNLPTHPCLEVAPHFHVPICAIIRSGRPLHLPAYGTHPIEKVEEVQACTVDPYSVAYRLPDGGLLIGMTNKRSLRHFKQIFWSRFASKVILIV